MSAKDGPEQKDSSENNVVRLGTAARQYAERMFKRADRKNQVFVSVEPRLQVTVPMVGAKVPAGFPSPADDYLDKRLCLNELLIRNPPATFVMEVDGDSMIGAGIYPRDLVIVDRSLAVTDKLIIVAIVDGLLTIKRFRRTDKRVWLHAENPSYPDITITEDTEFVVWGGVYDSIRRHARR